MSGKEKDVVFNISPLQDFSAACHKCNKNGSAPQATFHTYYSFDLLLFVFRTCSIGLPISSATRFGFNVPGSDWVFPPHTNNFPFSVQYFIENHLEKIGTLLRAYLPCVSHRQLQILVQDTWP